MKIAWFDGGRHRRNSGYGHAARNLLTALLDLAGAEIVLLGPQPDWEEGACSDPRMEELESVSDEAVCDFAIQVATPEGARTLSVPSALYTFLDVSGPTIGQEAICRDQAFMIAPNRTMVADYTQRGLTSVLFQPYIDTKVFRPQPRWREEGADCPSFIFVGTHSYRKATDVLIAAFLRAFPQADAHLHLHIPGRVPDSLFNTVTEMMRRHGHPGNITLSSKYLSLAWLARFYARSDCFVTATRGEGWGIPPMEAMASGLPLIAPDHGGLKDFVDPATLFELGGEVRPIAGITAPFGGMFKGKYDDANALSYFEPDPAALVARFREVADMARAPQGREALAERGARGRQYILDHFGPAQARIQAAQILAAIQTALSGGAE